MQRVSIPLIALSACLAFAAITRGQGLLDQVEKGLKTIPGGGRTPAGDSPPSDDSAELPPPAVPAESPRAGYLGVVLNDSEDSLVISEIAKDSPAEKAGLKPEDQIATANKVIVKNAAELGVVLDPLLAGEKLTLSIVRDGKPMTIVATLSDPPADAAPADPEIKLGSPLGPGAGELPPPDGAEANAAPGAEDKVQRASLGISVMTFNDELRQRSDAPARSGAIISTIRPESPAARAGLPLGGVIVAYDGRKVESADELVGFIRDSRPGQEVELTYFQGPTLRRKSVTLAAAADPGLLGPGYGGLVKDRPLFNRTERAIEGLTRPDAGADAPGSHDHERTTSPAEAASLREDIETLKAKVATLEEKLAAIEAKLTAAAQDTDAGAAPAPGNTGGAAPAIPRVDSAPRRSPTRAPIRIGDE